jgi:hypothetical protein
VLINLGVPNCNCPLDSKLANESLHPLPWLMVFVNVKILFLFKEVTRNIQVTLNCCMSHGGFSQSARRPEPPGPGGHELGTAPCHVSFSYLQRSPPVDVENLHVSHAFHYQSPYGCDVTFLNSIMQRSVLELESDLDVGVDAIVTN